MAPRSAHHDDNPNELQWAFQAIDDALHRLEPQLDSIKPPDPSERLAESLAAMMDLRQSLMQFQVSLAAFGVQQVMQLGAMICAPLSGYLGRAWLPPQR